MIVECERCHAKYHYEEERFGGKASKKLRCSKCQAIFEVVNTRAYEAGPPMRPPVFTGDTHLRRNRESGSTEIPRPPRRRRGPGASPGSRTTAGCRSPSSPGRTRERCTSSTSPAS